MKNFNLWVLLIIILSLTIVVCLNVGVFIEQRRKTEMDCEPSMVCKKQKGGLVCNKLNLN